jgi:hypothetical protein
MWDIIIASSSLICRLWVGEYLNLPDAENVTVYFMSG